MLLLGRYCFVKRTDLDRIKVSKADDEIFELTYDKNLQRIRLDRAYSETIKALSNSKFIKLVNKPAFDMILKRIRTEINRLDGTDGVFVAFTETKVLSNERLRFKSLSYFEDVIVPFRKVTR